MLRAQPPVILLAFANPRRDLHNLTRESAGIAELFGQQRRQVHVEILDHPSLDQITDLFQGEYRDRVAVFHYGGHASGFDLMLESDTGETHHAGARGLARFLAHQKGLQLVFLNGCSTKGQVDALLDAGVERVIATSRAINDGVATKFALEVYESLLNGADLDAAFGEASGIVSSSVGDNVRATYELVDTGDTTETPEENPWKLYPPTPRRDQSWSLKREIDRRNRSVVSNSDTASVRGLQRLLEVVKEEWVERASLYERDEEGLLTREPLVVCKETRPDLVSRDLDRFRESDEKQGQALPQNARVYDVFDDAQQLLLIVGKPGSGKSTALRDLASELVYRAEIEPEQPVPVIFLLSTWNEEFPSLQAWMQNELSEKYGTPDNFSPQWIEQHKILPLLDGLDEVAAPIRDQCVEAIHEFQRTIGTPGMAVTCRAHEYDNLGQKLKLRDCISLSPLTKEQIFEHLDGFDGSMDALTQALRTHKPLLDLAESPLMLDTMKKAFGDADSIDTSQLSSLDECQAFLYGSYVNRMFQRRLKLTTIQDAEQTRRNLTGLAQRMTLSGSTHCLIETMQPSWISGTLNRWIHGGLTTGVLGLVSAFVVWFFWYCAASISSDLTELVRAGLLGWLISLYLGWFLYVAWVEHVFPKLSVPTASPVVNNVRGIGKMFLLFFGWCVLAVVVRKVIIFDPNGNDVYFPVVGMCGVVLTFIIGSYGYEHRALNTIQSVDKLGINKKQLLVGVPLGAVAGFLLWIPYRLAWDPPDIAFFWIDQPSENAGFTVYLVAFVLMGMQLGGFTRGLRPVVVDESETNKRTQPNQGMRLSLRNGLFGGAVAAVLAFLTTTLMFYLQKEKTIADGILFAGGATLLAFYCCFHWFGGFQLFKHWMLRVVIAAMGQMPLRIDKFLENATKLRILKRRGGGYMFMHGTLGEYFCEVDDAAK